jgi:hypothetical protein
VVLELERVQILKDNDGSWIGLSEASKGQGRIDILQECGGAKSVLV